MERIIAILPPNDVSKGIIKSFPKWHGIEFSYKHISEYKNKNSEDEYIVISQSKDYDSGIFEIVATTLRLKLKLVLQSSFAVFLMHALVKWKKFFSLNSGCIIRTNATGIIW